ncbi:MAG: hypothetical protein EBV72_11160 [Betaproteobacteria bacterium]|nr:hypothetical protein [Betaproteobacteria bacterium]
MSLSINGELLKAARLRRGLSIATWARELMVSETQLRSLEEGEDRGFYNDTHRRQIAQKYAIRRRRSMRGRLSLPKAEGLILRWPSPANLIIRNPL